MSFSTEVQQMSAPRRRRRSSQVRARITVGRLRAQSMTASRDRYKLHV